jgi:NADPH:quinone reductase-like Zn-dependent oxidoreductase
MAVKAEAWFLYPGDGKPSETPASLVRGPVEIGDLGPEDVLAQPIYGCWEANMDHALNRDPIDICKARKEPRVILGNAGVVKVLEVGSNVKTVRPGQHAVIHGSGGQEDWWGYPVKITGFDAPNSMGCLATRMKVTWRELIPIPANSRHTLAQWAAFSVRYMTAWSNWELARGVFRLQVSADELASINVWGWGGGTTLAELELAHYEGHKAVMLSANPQRLAAIGKTNVTPLDRTQYGELYYDEDRFEADADYRERYRKAEAAFVADVHARTSGRMVHIFVEMIGAPVYRATLRALAREGVITTAGWKEGMDLRVRRASECISRHQHIFTHGSRYQQGWKAVAFAEHNGWLPIVDERIYTFDEIPELARNYRAGDVGLFPCFSVDP